MGLTTVEDQYLTGRTVLNCGEATAAEIDQEVMQVLKVSYDKALELLRGNMKALHEIAAFLIERETITGKEFMDILNRINHPETQVLEAETPAEAETEVSEETEVPAEIETEVSEETEVPAETAETTTENE